MTHNMPYQTYLESIEEKSYRLETDYNRSTPATSSVLYHHQTSQNMSQNDYSNNNKSTIKYTNHYCQEQNPDYDKENQNHSKMGIKAAAKQPKTVLATNDDLLNKIRAN